MKDAAPPPRRTGPMITAGVIFCLLTALAYAAWRTCAGPADRELAAQEPEARLGTLSFPNSGPPAAQRDFLRGVLLLHSFEYDAAGRAFRAAQAVDPGFVMAYWGEALTLTHPIWNQQDAVGARAVLARLGATAAARAARAATERERMYLAAVEALYGDGEKAARDTLYALAMDRLVAAHPDDDEARAFRALALMGLSQGIRDVPTYVRAGAEALEVRGRNPDHPGAAHYVIHAFDDPVHAPLALPAARAYSRIAPGAAHAQHMTTHIFLALGMWDEVVAQNIVASGPDSSRWRPGHYTSWLGYGLLQQGKFDAARAHLHRLRAQLGPAGSVAARGYLASMRADYVVNAERWDAPELAWELVMPEAGWLAARAADFYARGAAALRQGQPGNAEAALAGIRRLAGQAGTGDGAELVRAQVAIMGDELEAQFRIHQGDTAAGLDQLRAAAGREAALPAEFGPPSIVKPAWELLGEVLLAHGRAREAQTAFERALELQPGRILSLGGLAEAAQANGDAPAADRAVLRLPRGVGRDP